MNPNLYEVLKVNKDASPDEIKKAYRKEAMHSHPDAGGDPEDFKALTIAFEILSDPNKRKEYDETGRTERRSQTSPEDMLVMFFNLVVEELIACEQPAEQVDLVAETRSKIKNRILLSSKTERTGLKALAKVRVILKRLSGGDGDSILIASLKSREAQYEYKFSLCDKEKKELHEALDLLDSYSYATDSKPNTPNQKSPWEIPTMEFKVYYKHPS